MDKNINQQLINQDSSLVDQSFVQKIHHTNPMGKSNDIQSIVPHYKDGKIDYWDGYYLWDVKSSGGNQWFHFKTKDFGKIVPFDESNPIGLNNVAIPDKWYDLNGVMNIEVDTDVNPVPLSWGFVATGSVLKNNTKANGQSWFSVDQWGNTINPDAKIACFSTFGYENATHLAYSNNDEQFHPISGFAEIDSTMVGIGLGGEFRDPLLTTNPGKDKLIVYEAGGLASRIYPLTSMDGFNWEHNQTDNININILNDSNFYDRMIETPFITTINNQPLMFFGIQNHDGQPGSRSVSHVGWIAGRFKDNGIFAFEPNAKHGFLDDGFDNYAGNFVKLDDNHLAYIGWQGNWGYFNGRHEGSLTTSRIITWNSSSGIKAEPIDPGALTNYSNFKLDPQSSSTFNVGKKVYLKFDNQLSNFNITITRADNDNNKIHLSLSNGVFSYDRLGSGNGATDLYDKSNIEASQLGSVELYLDNTSVEAYLPDVGKIYTFSNFSGKDAGYKIAGDVALNVSSFDVDMNQDPTPNQVVESAR